MLQIKDIYKEYRTGDLVQKALDHVSLNLRDNEFVAILGPSGSGKTTLLNIIGGLDQYDSGDLVINEISTKNYKDKDWDSYRNHTIGFVFQSYNLIATMNALENVALPLSFRGVPRDVRLKKAKQYLQLVGLEKFMKHMPSQMSGGQQQRVGIARALVVNPQIIFADEPTGNLDSKTTMEVLKLMQQIVREQNQTLVMVTHDNHLATYADRIFKIIDGKIVHIEENRRTPDGEETRELPGLSDRRERKV